MKKWSLLAVLAVPCRKGFDKHGELSNLLSDTEVRDLFAFLASTTPPK